MKLLRFNNSQIWDGPDRDEVETEVLVVSSKAQKKHTLCVSVFIMNTLRSTRIDIDEEERDELVEFLQQLKFK